MNLIIDIVFEYRLFYLIALLLIILDIILLVFLRPKKVKPINFTIDDVDKDTEKSEIEKVIEALELGQADRPMTTFEEEQEANAIISYQELVRAVNEKKSKTNGVLEVTTQKESEIPQELLETETVEALIDDNVEYKFKNSEFISPIFGKDSNKTNDEFLIELKNFRSNL